MGKCPTVKIGRPLKPIDLEWAKMLREQGLTWAEIASELGVNRNTLQLARKSELIAKADLAKKKCGGYCQRILPLSEFSVDRSRRDGRNVKCRSCVSRRWKELYSRPCVDCGRPRRSVTPGQCARCYRMTILLKKTEMETLAIIPGLILEHRQRLLSDLVGNDRMRPVDKLLTLVERVTSGNTRSRTT